MMILRFFLALSEGIEKVKILDYSYNTLIYEGSYHELMHKMDNDTNLSNATVTHWEIADKNAVIIKIV